MVAEAGGGQEVAGAVGAVVGGGVVATSLRLLSRFCHGKARGGKKAKAAEESEAEEEKEGWSDMD